MQRKYLVLFQHRYLIQTRARIMRIESAALDFQNVQKAWFETSAHALSDIRSALKSTHSARDPDPSLLGQLSLEEHPIGSDGSNYRAKIWYFDRQDYQCHSRCPCKCHIGKQNGQVRLAPFGSIVGSLSILYSGWELTGPRCNVLLCDRARLKLLEVTYSTPPQGRGISIVATLKVADGEPTMGLNVGRTVNIRPHDVGIFRFSRAGQLSDLKRELQMHPSAVLDVNKIGVSALFHALKNKHLDAEKFLLAAGADPFLEDEDGTPTIYQGIRHLVQGKFSTQEEDQWRDCLPFSAFFEDYSVPHIQRVVIGLRPLNLQAELEKGYGAEVNTKDGLGMTALHWAAMKGDTHSVKTLLSAGALVDDPDFGGSTPLYEACLRGSEQCTDILMAFGADVNKRRKKKGYGTIHYAARANATHGLLSSLLSNGADIEDSRNVWGGTPLALAIDYDSTQSCKHLLELGADIEHIDEDGDTPLFQAVASNAHGCLKMLLSRKANHLHKRRGSQTLLHFAAGYGDEQTLKILTTARLKGLDVTAKDSKSMNARQHFAKRTGLSRETVEAFDALIASLQENNMETEELFDLESGDEGDFVDALESQGS